jgi:DNA mismatch repair ATPase MutS
MLIDAQAIEHLDILPPNRIMKSSDKDQSLFNYLSQGIRTPFGKRMLKRWVVSPLTDKD